MAILLLTIPLLLVAATVLLAVCTVSRRRAFGFTVLNCGMATLLSLTGCVHRNHISQNDSKDTGPESGKDDSERESDRETVIEFRIAAEPAEIRSFRLGRVELEDEPAPDTMPGALLVWSAVEGPGQSVAEAEIGYLLAGLAYATSGRSP